MSDIEKMKHATEEELRRVYNLDERENEAFRLLIRRAIVNSIWWGKPPMINDNDTPAKTE